MDKNSKLLWQEPYYPLILLLDEATSALDSKSKKLVQDALKTAMKGRTIILIAHKMSIIVNAYMIVVVQNGQVTETRTHSNLLQTSEFYSNLFNMQNISTEGEPSSISHVKKTETTDQLHYFYEVIGEKAMTNLQQALYSERVVESALIKSIPWWL
nr:ABC transporter B family member 19-like [Tanacetum cinerariifolium]